jgi:N-hydroxyarylamine O-acetyltransferase
MSTFAPADIRESTASREWVDRYLALLGVTHPEPSLDALTVLIRAQFRAVPFENVTSLLRRLAHPDRPVPPVDPEALLASWEAGRGGGVCYEISTMFGSLLQALGYEARQVLAQISFPDGHQAIVVTLDGARYLVDVGTGSPIFRPIPLEGTEELHHAGLSYRFRPGDEPGYWQQDRLIDGEWTRFTRYDLGQPTEERRIAAYQRHHTFGESWVVDTLRMVRCEDDAVYSATGNELTSFTPQGKRTERLTSLAAYERIAGLFHAPNLPLAEAMRARPGFVPSVGG